MKSKRIIAAVCSLLVLVGLFPGTAFAEEESISIGDPVSTEELEEWNGFSYDIPELQSPTLFGSNEGIGEIESYAETWYPSISSESEWQVLYLVNKVRASQGLRPLAMFDRLQNVARTRAGELHTLFSHTRPNGSSWDTTYGEAGINKSGYSIICENIAYGTTSPTTVMNLWINSPTHLANILMADVTHLGVGQNNTGWSQNFLGTNNAPTSISIVGQAQQYDLPQNYSIEDFGILLRVQDSFGISYLPLIEEMCRNLNMNSAGIQTVSVDYRGVSTTLNVKVDKPWNFTDVPSDAWFANDVYTIYNLGIMTGLNDTTFGPSEPLGRGQFATILYRMEGSPSVAYQNVYPDVPNGQFYTSPAMWGRSTGIITGYQNGRFGPADRITREQVATILYRYTTLSDRDAGKRADLSSFPDHGSVSGFAREAMTWAVGTGIISGSQGQLKPQGDASRAECATMIIRLLNAYNNSV